MSLIYGWRQANPDSCGCSGLLRRQHYAWKPTLEQGELFSLSAIPLGISPELVALGLLSPEVDSVGSVSALIEAQRRELSKLTNESEGLTF